MLMGKQPETQAGLGARLDAETVDMNEIAMRGGSI
jgi:hypothetical protein